ncbi:MAG: hypothetical protein HWD62_01855 [Cyclobacteriaceae bacterium]|nr:MAG: hypothetical protein HWD62_01855 [Cyclobacteriaceae bacterium]
MTHLIDRSSASWDFELRGVTLITIPAGGDFSKQAQVDLPLFMDLPIGKGTFGAAVYVNTKRQVHPNQMDICMYMVCWILIKS